ncbi:MAG: 4Fe-4S binding protein [Verrucomicrobiota bacterium]|jgi:NADH-quinone oxidoreductase subunit I
MLGRGLLRGFFETGRNFCGSYYDPARLTTVQYPEEKLAPQENARTVPFLVYDGEDPLAGLRCTACTICAQECPAHCMEVVKDTEKKADYLGKMQVKPRVFAIDMSVCMGCGICVEVCPFDSIKMDQVFELAREDRRMLLQLKDLAKSNAYFHQIHPGEAAAVDEARAEEKRKAQAKRATAAAPATPAIL